MLDSTRSFQNEPCPIRLLRHAVIDMLCGRAELEYYFLDNYVNIVNSYFVDEWSVIHGKWTWLLYRMNEYKDSTK